MKREKFFKKRLGLQPEADPPRAESPIRYTLYAKKGFTLIELMVVITILVIFMGSLFVIFKNSTDAWQKSEARLEIYQNARTILEQMSREIQTAYFNEDEGIHAVGYDAGSGIKAGSQEDEFFFVGPVENSGDMDLAEIGYWVNNNQEMMRHFEVASGSRPDCNFNTGASNQLALHVYDLELKYYYRRTPSGNWSNSANAADDWDSSSNDAHNYDIDGNSKSPDGLPNGIEIELILEDPTPLAPTAQDRYTFTTWVHLPQAK